MGGRPIKGRKFTVILEAESDGGYSVYCPALPGCVSQGDDRTTALANIREAIELVLDVAGATFSDTPNVESGSVHCLETPARIAEDVWEVLEGRGQDSLPFTGISPERATVCFGI